MNQVECIESYYDTLLNKTIKVGDRFEVNDKRLKTLVDNQVVKKINKEIEETDK